MVKFGTKEWTHGVLYDATFCLYWYIVIHVVQRTANVTRFFSLGAPMLTPFTDQGQIGHASGIMVH